MSRVVGEGRGVSRVVDAGRGTGRRGRALAGAVAALALAAAFAAAGNPPAADASAKTADTARTQKEASIEFIRHLLLDQRDSAAALFEDTLRHYVTDELVKRYRSQFKWLYDFIGGDFVQFHSGGTDSFFFREYRLANETNKRFPLIVVQTVFRDSTDPTMVGGNVKNFLGSGEKNIAGAQTWTVDGRELDLHGIVLAETPRGPILALQLYDESTGPATNEAYGRTGIALVREALARGYMDSAYARLDSGQTLGADVGVVFIRKDPEVGFIHTKIGFGPESYAPVDSTDADDGAETDGAPAKTPPKKKKK